MRYFFLTLFCGWCFANTWSEPVNLVSESNTIYDYNVSMDANGNGLVVWFDDDDYVLLSRKWNGSEWEAAVEIDTPGVGSRTFKNMSLSMNAQGQALMAATYEDLEDIYGWYYDGSDWSDAVQLTDDQNGDDPTCVFNNNGFGVVAWEVNETGPIEAITFQNGTWADAPTQISEEGEMDSPWAAINNNNTAVVMWDREGEQILGAFYRNGQWEDQFALTEEGDYAAFPSNWAAQCVAMNESGHVLCAWEGDGTVEAAFYNGSTWNVQTVYDDDNEEPSVCLDDHDNGFVAFEDSDEVWISKVTNGNIAEAQEIFPDEGPDVYYPKVQCMNQGGALVVFDYDDGLAGMTYDGSSWAEADVIMDDDFDIYEAYPILALSKNGSAIALVEDEDEEALYASVFTPSPASTPPQNVKAIPTKNALRCTWAPSQQTGINQLQLTDTLTGQAVSSPFIAGGEAVLPNYLYKSGRLKVQGISPFNQRSSSVLVQEE